MTDRDSSRRRTGTEREHVDRGGYTRAVERRLPDLAWLARAAGVGLSGVSIGFVVLFVVVLETGGELTLITQPLPMRVALALPPVIAVLATATTVGTALAWWNDYWSLRVRLHQTALALLGLGFSWQLAALGFLAL